MKDGPAIEMLPLSAITLDVELQPRDEIDQDLVGDYATLLFEGVEFPPVVAFRNGGETLLLADGFHRFYAHKALKKTRIAVEVREGDRLAAIRASLAANSTHGRQRSPGTLARAYRLAVKHGLVDPADPDAVAKVLRCGGAKAYELTKEARDDRDKATRSIALQLEARGCTQTQIADQLGVDQKTISRWVRQISTVEKCLDAPVLPDAASLDRIAESIRSQAKAEVKAEAAAEIKAEVEAIRKDFADRLAELKKEIADAELAAKQDREAAEAAHDATLALKQAINATEREATNNYSSDAEKIDQAVDNWNQDAPERAAWRPVWEAVEAAQTIDLEALSAGLFRGRDARTTLQRSLPKAIAILAQAASILEGFVHD